MPPSSKSPAPSKAPSRPPAPYLPALLRQAWFNLNRAFRQRITHAGCTPDQYTVLRNLIDAGPAGLTQNQLTHLMSSDPNTVTALVRRMESLKMVRRTHDPSDRRARRVRILPKGRQRFRQLRPRAAALLQSVMQAVPARQQPTFLAQLALVANACAQSHSRKTGSRTPR